MTQKNIKNQSSFCTLVWFAAACALMTGCGGGGGGGGGSEGVRILHASIDSVPFNLSSSAKAAEVLETAKFSLPAGYQGISSGAQVVSATGTLGAPVFSFDVAAKHPARQSILIYGSRFVSGTRGALLADEAGKIPSGQSAVRLVNGLDKAGNLNASAGGVSIGDNVALGSAAEYTMIDSGVQDVVVKTARGWELTRGPESFESGKAYTVLAAGEADYLVIARVIED